MAEGAAPSDGHFHGEVPSNLGQDNNAQEAQPREALRDAPGREEHMLAVGRPPSSSTKSLGKAIQDGITSPRAEELTKGTAVASSAMKSFIPVDPKTEENVNSPGKVSSLTLDPMKTIRDAIGSEEHSLAVGRPPSSSTESRGKAIEDSDEEHDGKASSTKIIPKANADAGPSVRAPAKHDNEVVAVIGGPDHPNASNVASNAAPPIPAIAQHHDGFVAAIGSPAQANATDDASNATPAIPAIAQHDANIAIGGGGGGPPAPAQINGGGGNAVIPARPALAQPNAAPPVPVLPPNPGVNYIDEVLMNCGIRPLQNPVDEDEGKLWGKLN